MARNCEPTADADITGLDHVRDMLGEVGPAYTRGSSQPIGDPVEGWMHVVGCIAINADQTPSPCHIIYVVIYVVQAQGVGIFSGDQVFDLPHGHVLTRAMISASFGCLHIEPRKEADRGLATSRLTTGVGRRPPRTAR